MKMVKYFFIDDYPEHILPHVIRVLHEEELLTSWHVDFLENNNEDQELSDWLRYEQGCQWEEEVIISIYVEEV